MVTRAWNSIILDDNNGMVRFKKKLQFLKKEIRVWVLDQKQKNLGRVNDIKAKLSEIDVKLDQGGVNDEILHSRLNLMKQLHDQKVSDTRECMQKAKIRWAIEGDENSKFFHGIINRKRANLSIRGVMVDGEWAMELERLISNDEIRKAVWGCGEDKSPGPDGFTFDFFRKFWDLIGPDFCVAVDWFFEHCSFSRGCNSSFFSLIPKVPDPKFVTDYRPISLIGSLYKVVTKILATRLSVVISELVSDVQTVFVPSRQILDGPFIINELLSWCKHHKHQDMVFKVDFAKAYDSIRWDYLDDVLRSFGFGVKWCSWIKGSLTLSMASILVNGSPTTKFQFHCIFKGIKIDNAVTISHLFYTDDAVFIGEWSDGNLNRIMHVLHCFSLASGLMINVKKSRLLGVGIPHAITSAAAMKLGCSIMITPFKYLGVMVGGNMSRLNVTPPNWVAAE
ncbi:RNA-directed DNA polymerase, eukaryota [Tanacetum coccineum]